MIEDIKVDANGNELHFRSNTLLRPAGIKINLTKEHVEEYVKCSKDIIYFTETYVYISDPNKGRSLIKLYDYQKDLLLNFQNNKYNIALQARQSGKSQVSAIFIVWYILFHNDKVIAMLANKAQIAREIFSRVLDTFELLPHFLKPGVKYYNKSTLDLDNGSKVIASATSKFAIRGFTCVDENTTHVTVRNKKTNKTEKILIKDFLERIEK